MQLAARSCQVFPYGCDLTFIPTSPNRYCLPLSANPPPPSPPPPPPVAVPSAVVPTGIVYRYTLQSFLPGGVLMDQNGGVNNGTYTGTVAGGFDPAGTYGLSATCSQPGGGIWSARGASGSSTVTFAGSLPTPLFSYCLLTRYTGATRGRIISGNYNANAAGAGRNLLQICSCLKVFCAFMCAMCAFSTTRAEIHGYRLWLIADIIFVTMRAGNYVFSHIAGSVGTLYWMGWYIQTQPAGLNASQWVMQASIRQK